MLEQSVTKMMDVEGLQKERAWHRMEELYLAPNDEIVPGTEWRNCTWHQMTEWCQVQSYDRPHTPIHQKTPWTAL